MKRDLVRISIAVALAGAATLSQAATVYFSDWAYGNSWGNTVDVGVPNYSNVPAGGFKGSVTFTAAEKAAGFNDILNNGFISYCVELTESFYGFPSAQMSGYDVVPGSTYAGWGNARASRLGQLMSYVSANSQLVDTKDESTSLQLAIWNVIYDQASDNSLTSGLFQEKTPSGSFNAYADKLLSDSLSATNTYDVFVLTKASSQDFMLLREKGSNVPEPSSVALAFAALGALGVASRRRGVSKA